MFPLLSWNPTDIFLSFGINFVSWQTFLTLLNTLAKGLEFTFVIIYFWSRLNRLRFRSTVSLLKMAHVGLDYLKFGSVVRWLYHGLPWRHLYFTVIIRQIRIFSFQKSFRTLKTVLTTFVVFFGNNNNTISICCLKVALVHILLRRKLLPK